MTNKSKRCLSCSLCSVFPLPKQIFWSRGGSCAPNVSVCSPHQMNCSPSRLHSCRPTRPTSIRSNICGRGSSATRWPTTAPTTSANCIRPHATDSRALRNDLRSLPLAGCKLRWGDVMQYGKINKTLVLNARERCTACAFSGKLTPRRTWVTELHRHPDLLLTKLVNY